MTKKVVFLLFIFALFSCAVKPARHSFSNIQQTSSHNPIDSTSIIYGSYRGALPFRAIAVKDNDTYRIIIMDDLGAKLQDIKIDSSGKIEEYFCVNDIPKKHLEDLEAFFCEYFFCIEKKNIQTAGGRIFFYDENNVPILWINAI